MRHFVITSTAFTGTLEYKYCNQGYLIWFSYNADMTPEQREHALTKMPLTVAGFDSFRGNSKTMSVAEIIEDISFDSFWELYGNKINKKRCIPLFNKLTTQHRRNLIRSIPAYKTYLTKTNFRNMADPETYIRKEMYLNNWNKL